MTPRIVLGTFCVKRRASRATQAVTAPTVTARQSHSCGAKTTLHQCASGAAPTERNLAADDDEADGRRVAADDGGECSGSGARCRRSRAGSG